MRLLLTRPEAEAKRTAAVLRAQGHAVTVAPLLRIEPVGDAPLGAGPWAAIVVTSGNAARAIAVHSRFSPLLALPVFAVGRRSAQAMTEIGFADVTSADGDAEDLVRLVAARLKPGARLLYLAGADRAGDLAGELRSRGFAVETAIVYRAIAAALPPAAAEALANDLDAVLHFSRRSVETYINAARDADMLAAALKPVHFCLSAQVAEPLQRAGAPAVRVAAQPTEAALIALVGGA